MGKKWCRILGVAVALSLFFMVVSPLTLARTAPPPPPQATEEEGMLGPILDGLLLTPEGMKGTEFPYPQLEACLGFILPPMESCLQALPTFVGNLFATIQTLLKVEPAKLEMVLKGVIKRIIVEPYGIIALVDLILNPLSLSLLNPLTWPEDPIVGVLCSGLTPVGCCVQPLGSVQICLTNVCKVTEAWMGGLGIVGALPSVITVLLM